MKRLMVAFGVVLALVIGAAPAHADDYNATRGAVDGSRNAAGLAFDANGNNSCGMSEKRLAAMMLGIAIWEVAGGSRTRGPSPMTLSRGDNAAARSDNIYLNSFNTIENRKRAFWAPGVGLFQIDTIFEAQSFNHYQRMQPLNGGKLIASKLLNRYCISAASAKAYMAATWFACDGANPCWDTYNEIFDGDANALKLDINENETSWTGGALTYNCRLGTTGDGFNCALINVAVREGYFFTDFPDGTESASNPSGYTPLPLPFMSYNRNDKKWAQWLVGSTPYATPVVRSSPLNADARDQENAWYDSSQLQVYYCVDPPGPEPQDCFWSTSGPPV